MKNLFLNLTNTNIHLVEGFKAGIIEVSKGIGYKIENQDIFVFNSKTKNSSCSQSEFEFVKIQVPFESENVTLNGDLNCCNLIQMGANICTVNLKSQGSSIVSTSSENLLADVKGSLVANFHIMGGKAHINSVGISTLEVTGDISTGTFNLTQGTEVFIGARGLEKFSLGLDNLSKVYEI